MNISFQKKREGNHAKFEKEKENRARVASRCNHATVPTHFLPLSSAACVLALLLLSSSFSSHYITNN